MDTSKRELPTWGVRPFLMNWAMQRGIGSHANSPSTPVASDTAEKRPPQNDPTPVASDTAIESTPVASDTAAPRSDPTPVASDTATQSTPVASDTAKQ